ncbi:WhiB family transcriptional regulator [Streptomyces sp. NPDC059862]|uniref:WhiB family transcriptional regulator n=1 Tax=Streptomyces sp. NPDC059862 TaxID=3346975 RepID=UPI003669FC30
MQLHDPKVDATTRHRATPPENDSQKINLLPLHNVTPHRSGPQRSRRCPVVEQCLDWAIQVGQVEGIWGGMTDSERRALRRRQARRTTDTVTTAA